jgi:CRISPR-associated protein Csx10
MIIKYQLTVETEYHIGTGLEHPGVVDRTLMARPDGTLVIPAEHFRGLVRDACTQILYWIGEAEDAPGEEKKCCEASLKKAPSQSTGNGVPPTCGLNFRSEADPCILCRLFGTTFLPKRYHFFDAKLNEQSKGSKAVSMHNRVDPATGRVPEETFFALEVGAPATFRGKIESFEPQFQDSQGIKRDEEVSLLLAGLRLVERVGGRSRRGWGKCRVTIDEQKSELSQSVDSLIGTYLRVEPNGGAK